MVELIGDKMTAAYELDKDVRRDWSLKKKRGCSQTLFRGVVKRLDGEKREDDRAIYMGGER